MSSIHRQIEPIGYTVSKNLDGNLAAAESDKYSRALSSQKLGTLSNRNILNMPKQVVSSQSISILESRSHSTVSSYNNKPSNFQLESTPISRHSSRYDTLFNKSPTTTQTTPLNYSSLKKDNMPVFTANLIRRGPEIPSIDSRSKSPLSHQFHSRQGDTQNLQTSSVRSISITHSQSTQPPQFIVIDGVKHVKVSTTNPSNLQYVSEKILDSKGHKFS